MSQAGRDIRNGGQSEQARRKLPGMGDEEEEVLTRVFVFAIAPASRCRLQTQLWDGCMGTLCRMLLQGAGTETPVPSGAASHGCKPLRQGERAGAQPGETARPSPKSSRKFPPDTPGAGGGHLFKEEGTGIGAVIGASWEAPGDPYKGLRGVGAALTFCGLEGG